MSSIVVVVVREGPWHSQYESEMCHPNEGSPNLRETDIGFRTFRPAQVQNSQTQRTGTGGPNPVTPEPNGHRRQIRGGAWDNTTAYSTVTSVCVPVIVEDYDYTIGFRTSRRLREAVAK